MSIITFNHKISQQYFDFSLIGKVETKVTGLVDDITFQASVVKIEIGFFYVDKIQHWDELKAEIEIAAQENADHLRHLAYMKGETIDAAEVDYRRQIAKEMY